MDYELDYLETMPTLFHDAVSRHGSMDLYVRKTDDGYDSITYNEMRDQVEIIGMGLHSLGYSAGNKVAILSENKPEWIMTDYACAHFGIVSVPVYPTLLPEQVSYILNDSEASLVFVSNEVQAKKIIQIKEKLPYLQKMVIYANGHALDEEWIIDYADFCEQGISLRNKVDFSLEDEGAKRTKDELWTIIYTSGTTGTPKGVMLSQFNAASNAQASQATLQFESGRKWLSFLPYSHSLERIAAHFSFFIGSTILVIEGIETVLEDLKKFKPNYFVSVPRLYEKVHNGVLQKIHAGSFIKQKIFNWATNVGSEVSTDYLQRGKEPSGWLATKYGIAQKLVFSKITELFGGEAIMTISGGAPLSKEIGEFFAAAGLLIIEGFGLTEMSPVTNANRTDFVKFGTVGPTIPDVQMRIAEDGEVLFKGPNQMLGYFKNPEATKEVIDDEGWLHTGDIGEIDDDGYLAITDRKKNLIVTSGGKNVAPAPLESKISGSRYIDQVVIVGDKRKFLSALVVPNLDALEFWAKSNGLEFEDESALLESDEVYNLLHKEIKDAQGEFAHFEQVKKFALIEKSFTIEDGELTPTLKIKRRVVEEKYRDKIDAMYPGT
ncbi:MAG: long-chain fatty acid--CoA ligase [Candidatus Marinimicrobia bacterium]|nr:long-chain fatty acid--CoA ligase [Candidatus Neomarinimicrobiota bacterium]MCF7829320.1 long-chain fatty acid--CoA ligase [Candidatus Neomarinimicrobiota bacterium]MCF7880018.1 long-chain fatty acid--CoA ligase [Candidatus Neomarinimicrobiota bacterium]